ncbi:MAG: hypothetical protein DRP02_14770 [Candidatus Gerdarchaeota archaeon]|nr:MAG: hypothetical protein DRP02_14770 [Candidatus Gerdarchaeota archaeon]
MADVGDGFCMGIHTILGSLIQVDCGGENKKVAFEGFTRTINFYNNVPDAFILSHFHVDHYNGLLYTSINPFRYPSFRIREVYYPRIPEFKRKNEFLLKLFTLNLAVFGSETGVMEYDLLRTITKLNNGKPPIKKPLSKGELIKINGSIFEVLWPPAEITEEKVLSVIGKALDDFDKAMEEDKELRRLYEHVEEEGIFRDYLSEEESNLERINEHYKSEKLHKRELPKIVKKANKSLREAANHLSLAFFEDNRLLFLGDTEKFEIKRIIMDLMLKERENFYVLVTSHHGTHWHKSLENVKCIYSLSSNGKKLCPKFRSEYKEIACCSLATFINGDIIIPIFP